MENRLWKLRPPCHPVDVVLDTDAYNEIDDQYAIAYLLRSEDKLRTKAIYAAPFENSKAATPALGMEASYREILHILQLMGQTDACPVYRGSEAWLPDEATPVLSEAARDLCRRAMEYSPEEPLYVIAIGAITNIASAILICPEILDRIVVVWLGGHALHWPNTREFNMNQDITAARVVMGSGVPLVQLPCKGVVSSFTLSEAELEHWLRGRNALCDYLVQHTVDEVTYAVGKPWTRVIWDVTAVAWLLGGFTEDRMIPTPMPQYDGTYVLQPVEHEICYVYHIHRDKLVNDLFEKLLR